MLQWLSSCKMLKTSPAHNVRLAIPCRPHKSPGTYSVEEQRPSWSLFCQGWEGQRRDTLPSTAWEKLQRVKLGGWHRLSLCLSRWWFLQVHPDLHWKASDCSSNCSTVTFCIGDALMDYFAKFFVALSISWDHPSHRRIPTSEGRWEVGVG